MFAPRWMIALSLAGCHAPVGTAAEMGGGKRFVHITSGPTWPLVEQVIAIP